ncbi:peptide chain release factor N(5)-glutamine methyltransferase [Marinomonas sp. 15G1-11]|uniref:Release factor glutamine methyltransferase n=1 Tax=Marinomonas phaeophyticola TaxID=3004091 RepID=A0ABT4JQE9_9GAMM|nr:peptide chain release factor N(5)-glutamine methyltransferase [Marinomonas sp. 15G1-11]MCZ2720610.1 peptide chain release factor N(5)-glutamine methyltransferase [Marinomonas sp. 15G1-11]
MRIDQCLKDGAAKLAALSDTAQLDTQLLLASILQVSTSYLYTWPEKEISLEQKLAFNKLLKARSLGEPIAYLLGVQEFWSLEFNVSPCTLIPRADTEVLVEMALEKIVDIATPLVLDLGTGTGAVALSIASERPTAQVHAVDLIEDAVHLARGNAKKLGLTASIYQSSWFESVEKKGFDLIVSNPPYIDEADHHLDEGDVRFEPKSALVADLSGYADIQCIAQEALHYLAPSGWLVFEHGFEQARRSQDILNSLGYKNVVTCQDYSGNDRVTLGQWLA